MNANRFFLPMAKIAVAAAAVAASALAQAQSGLAQPSAQWLWPQVQARITVQTVALSPVAGVALARPGDASAMRSVQGGGLFGDYLLASRALGDWRATGGLVLGPLRGLPSSVPSPMGRLGLDVLSSPFATAGSDNNALPYLGLGYSSPSLWRTVSITADVGLVASHPAGVTGVGRALFGTQAMDAALREMRLAPVLQLGLRYAF